MGSIFLAINYISEGWSLTEFPSADAAFQEVKNGNSYGNE